MIKQVVILADQRSKFRGINWGKMGRVVTELAELYQAVKDSRVDFILIDESSATVTQAMGNRIRRYNGLTEMLLKV